jgi:hypothetical protein
MTVRLRHLAALFILLVPGFALAQATPPDLEGHWAEGRIRDLVARRIVETFPDGTFRPHETVSRARFIAWLVAVKGLPLIRVEAPAFSDVPPTHPLSPQLETAHLYGIVPTTAEFRPGEPITRLDAIHYTVRALGHTFESAYMSGTALPYVDLNGLPPHLRGAVGVAALSVPPLLREPVSNRLRPREPMNRGEAASLVWSYLLTLDQPATLRATFPLGEGITLLLDKRGALRTLPVWRVQVGAFAEPERAAHLADEMRKRGLSAIVEVVDIFYKVRVGNFTSQAEAETLAGQLAGEGLQTFVILTLRDFDALPGPVWTAVLLLDGPTAGVRLRPAPARLEGLALDRTTAIARREAALAAVNGSYFSSVGDPLGCLMIDGVLLSEPFPSRSCVGILPDGGLLFDALAFAGEAATEVATATVGGVNRERRTDELVVYRRAYGSSTRTNAHGAEAVVVGDVVQQVLDGRGNAPIPLDGYVLSGHGRAGGWIRDQLRPGERVALRLRLVPASGDPRWEQVIHVIGGGPRILAEGRYVGGEGFAAGFTSRRHPRTAVARLADGRILLVVVDGRQPYHSLGMTLPELAVFLRALGATDAVNLDGGGSTTLVVRGTVVNLPSDEGGERPVSNALLVIRP